MKWIIAAIRGELKPTVRTDRVARAALVVAILIFLVILASTLFEG